MVRIIHCYNNEEGTYVICIDESLGRRERIEQEQWQILREKYGELLLNDPFSVIDCECVE